MELSTKLQNLNLQFQLRLVQLHILHLFSLNLLKRSTASMDVVENLV